LRFRYAEKLAELRAAGESEIQKQSVAGTENIRPRTVVPATPKHALKQNGIADRAVTARYSRGFERPAGPSQTFVATIDGPRPLPPTDEAAKALNRCLHPMNDELPGDLGPPKTALLDTSERDGVPGFLDRRKVNGNADDGGEATFLDLVGGDR
jgi:hypothetical protein